MRYLQVNVYRNTEFGDCTNSGVTSKEGNVFLVPHDRGPWSEEDVERNANWIVLEPHMTGGQLNFKPKGVLGWAMAGGNFIHSFDSRF